MSNIIFHSPPSREDVEYISDNLRDKDFEEFVMATGKHPFGLLANRAMASSETLIATIDSKPAAVFGCVPQGRAGAPWLLGTPAIEGFAAARVLIEQGRDLLACWAEEYPDGLKHRAYADNEVHLKYLRHLGCEIGDPKPYGPYGAPFREFRYV